MRWLERRRSERDPFSCVCSSSPVFRFLPLPPLFVVSSPHHPKPPPLLRRHLLPQSCFGRFLASSSFTHLFTASFLASSTSSTTPASACQSLSSPTPRTSCSTVATTAGAAEEDEDGGEVKQRGEDRSVCNVIMVVSAIVSSNIARFA
jgi:hypothetical protein